MALTFGAVGDLVDHATDFTIGTAGTMCVWLRPTSDTARQTIFEHQNGVTASVYLAANWRADLAGDNFSIARQRPTTQLFANAAAANFAAYALNSWVFLVYQFNTAGAASAQKILMGNLTLNAAEPSAYVTQDAGSGTPDTTTVCTLRVGNSFSGAGARLFVGDVAFLAYFNRVLTAIEIAQVQWRFMPLPGLLYYGHYGLFGTGTQPDWSGNGHTGAVTGATVAAHVPLGPLFSFATETPYIIAAPPPAAQALWSGMLITRVIN